MLRLATALLFTALLLVPVSALADHIGIYDDELGTNCHLNVTPPAPASVWVVHIYTLGTTASVFRVDDQSQQVQLGFASDNLVIGNPYSGVEVAYGGCFSGHVTVLRLDFLVVNPLVDCQNILRVVSHPNYPGVVVQDCNFLIKPASQGQFVFGPFACTSCSANPTEQKTWGSVKALYR
jgi:hypothetical protein